MLEREVIQSVGFRNIKKDGEVTGFQFKVRLPYYRGVFACQLRPGTLFVDGERIGKEDITWNIKGVDYTAEEMAENREAFWDVLEPAVLKVKKPGGLATGFHDLKYGFSFSSSYMPPIMQNDDALDPDKEAMIFMPEFGHHVNERRLLIV